MLRVGAAQQLTIIGVQLLPIMRAGGWRSTNVVARHVENVDMNVWGQWLSIQFARRSVLALRSRVAMHWSGKTWLCANLSRAFRRNDPLCLPPEDAWT